MRYCLLLGQMHTALCILSHVRPAAQGTPERSQRDAHPLSISGTIQEPGSLKKTLCIYLSISTYLPVLIAGEAAP